MAYGVNMATEKLVLELNAKVADAVKGLNKVKNTLTETDEKSKKTSKGMKKLGSASTVMAKAAFAAAAALTAIAVASAKADRRMENLATTAKMTKGEFKGLAFAFSQFDVDAKGAADALNDVSERVGEFAATFAKDGKGTGPFQDFADVMKLTAQEAGNFANRLENMSP